MARSLRTCHKPILQDQWRVAIPRLGDSVESGIFLVDGKKWKFKLESRLDNLNKQEEWIMYIERIVKNNDYKKFCVIAYVRDRLGDLFMAYREISSINTAIWSYTRRAFSASYPGIKVTEIIDFTFEFKLQTKISQDFVLDHKSTQTSFYMNDILCRENLSLDLRKLMEDSSNPDVQLKCGDCIIPAHRLILGARSEVFRAMLQTDMLEGREGSVKIVDMEPEIFQIFSRYLYTGVLPELTEDTASPLYEAGDKYRLEALKVRCGEFLADNLTLENACSVLTMVDAHSDPQLKDRVVSYIINEKVPNNNDEWCKFCDDHPRLAIEVLNRGWQSMSLVA